MDDGATYLTADSIRNTHDLKEDDVDCPEWGGKIRVRALSFEERNKIRDGAIKDGKLDGELYALLGLIHGAVQPRLTPLDVGWLRGKNPGAVERATLRVMELSGLVGEAQVKKDSPATPTSTIGS